jgi:hypothetical protein
MLFIKKLIMSLLAIVFLAGCGGTVYGVRLSNLPPQEMTYQFKGGQTQESISNATLEILQKEGFFIEVEKREHGYIKTDGYRICQRMSPWMELANYFLGYEIQITDNTVNVKATAKDKGTYWSTKSAMHEYGPSWTEKTEIKSCKWLIEYLMKTIGK